MYHMSVYRDAQIESMGALMDRGLVSFILTYV
jgi:hypothetical protein